jgi:hypothetical protein
VLNLGTSEPRQAHMLEHPYIAADHGDRPAFQFAIIHFHLLTYSLSLSKTVW